MRLFTASRIRRFCSEPAHHHAEDEFRVWIDAVEKATWTNPLDVKRSFNNQADQIGNNRMVFDIKGNHYRIVCEIHYTRFTVYVRFVGTHKQYDKIDAGTI